MIEPNTAFSPNRDPDISGQPLLLMTGATGFLGKYVALSGKMAWQMNQGWLKNSLKLPGLLIPARFEARFKPLNYSNEKAKNCLNWTSKYSLEEALNRSFSADNLLSIEN